MITIHVSTESPGLSVLTLAGELDMACAPEFAAHLERAIDAHCDCVVIDISRLTFMDSAGVRALLSGARTIQLDGGAIVLAAPTPSILRVLELVHASDVVQIEPSRAAALVRARRGGGATEPTAR